MIILVLAVRGSHDWDTSGGIVSWSGTTEGVKESGSDDASDNDIGFAYFLAIVPSLAATGWLADTPSTTA